MSDKILSMAIIFVFVASTTRVFPQASVPTGGKDIAVDPSGQIAFIAGNDYLIRSTDGGLTWSPTETPYLQPERVIVRIDDPQTVVVAKSGEVAYSTNAGSGSWTVALQDSHLVPLRLMQSPIDPNCVLLSRIPSDSTFSLWSSVDGGQTWFPQWWFTSRKFVFDMCMYPDTSEPELREFAWICGEGTLSSGYADGTWIGQYVQPAGTYATWTSHSVVWPPLRLYVTSFAVIPKPDPISPIELLSVDVPSEKDTIFSGRLYGPTVRLPIFWGADSIRMIRIRKSSSHVFVASDRGIFRSTDEGVTWEQKNFGLADTNIQAIALPDSGGKVFAVGSVSSSVSTDDGDSWQTVVTGVSPISHSAPSSFLLSQNYPNPFNPSTQITFSIPTLGFTLLKVYDVLGREVATLVNETLNAGSYTRNFTAEGLASGVYIYRLQSGDFVQARKLVLQK